jgi:hypothetical protein
MVKLRDADVQNYPHLCGYIRTDSRLAPGIPKLWSAFLDTSGMNELTACDSITGGTRSQLMIVSALDTDGDYRPEFPDDIEVSADLATQFETDFARKEAQDLVQSVLLSEIVAWRRAMSDGPGWQSYRSQFLKYAYGSSPPTRYWGTAPGTGAVAQLDTILAEYAPAGASLTTASAERLTFAGVAASRAIAQADEPLGLSYRDRFEAAGPQYNIPPALLCGIASREIRPATLPTPPDRVTSTTPPLCFTNTTSL